MFFLKISKKGLTLLELLLASTMTIFVGLGVFRAFTSGMAMYEWIDRNKPRGDAVIFFDKIAHDLRNYLPVTSMKFEGSMNRISFYVHNTDFTVFSPEVIESQGGFVDPAIYRVEYVFDPDKTSVYRRTYKYGAKVPFAATTAISDVVNIVFRYGNKRGSSAGGWEYFSSVHKGPGVVEISVDTTGGTIFRKVIEIPFNSV